MVGGPPCTIAESFSTSIFHIRHLDSGNFRQGFGREISMLVHISAWQLDEVKAIYSDQTAEVTPKWWFSIRESYPK